MNTNDTIPDDGIAAEMLLELLRTLDAEERDDADEGLVRGDH